MNHTLCYNVNKFNFLYLGCNKDFILNVVVEWSAENGALFNRTRCASSRGERSAVDFVSVIGSQVCGFMYY